MNKKIIIQTKENKEKFESYLMNPLLEKVCTKEELISRFGFSDRAIRNEIQEISMFFPVISNSKNKGYRIVDVEKAIKNNKQEEEINNINLTLGELQSRINVLKRKMNPLIATKIVLERSMNNNEDH